MDGSNASHRWSDWLFWMYNTIVAILLLLMGNHVEFRWIYLFSNVALIFLSIFFIRQSRRTDSKFWEFSRNWYPFGYFFYLHWESGMIGDLFFRGTFDSLVASWDIALIGDYLHDILYQFQPVWFSEFIHFTYFFYYILLVAPALLLYWDDRTRFAQYIFDVSLLYLIQYTIFYMFPVVGPIEMHYTKFPDGFLFIPLMKILYVIGDSPGGAMPSSHVSIAILAWYWLYKIKPLWAWISVFFVLCLVFSTVYLSFHYAIDAVIGFFLGVLFVLITESLRRKYRNLSFK